MLNPRHRLTQVSVALVLHPQLIELLPEGVAQPKVGLDHDILLVSQHSLAAGPLAQALEPRLSTTYLKGECSYIHAE